MTLTHKTLIWCLPAVLTLLLCSCTKRGLIPLNNAIEVERIDVTVQTETNKIDLLWVIDNSHSMCEEQDALTTNFESFITGLAEINVDFHISVITTDMSVEPGMFQNAPGSLLDESCSDFEPLACDNDLPNVLASVDYREDGQEDNPNAPVDLAKLIDDFQCIATVGTAGGGAGFERGLDAMREALSDDLLDTVNAGFRRESAWLAIIFVTDENDCSHAGAIEMTQGEECEWLREDLVDVQQYVNFTRTIAGVDDGERVLVAGIVGPDNGLRPERPEAPLPSCSNDDRGQAFAGYRYIEYIEAFGDKGVYADICHDDFQELLDQIARVIKANLGTKCLRTQPPTCEDSLDCIDGGTCYDPGDSGGIRICDNFELIVEIKDSDGSWNEIPGPTAEEPYYDINYDAASCATGIGVEFTSGHEPRPDEEFRVKYRILVENENINVSAIPDQSTF